MDYFSTFLQMLHAKKLSNNTIRVYVSYIKPYLAYLEELHLSPEMASYQTMRDFLDRIQSERGLADRTINMIISYLQFFQTYVLHKDWDKTQIPFRAFPTYLPYAPSPDEVRRFLLAAKKPKVRLAVSMLYATGMLVVTPFSTELLRTEPKVKTPIFSLTRFICFSNTSIPQTSSLLYGNV